jgi:hypothetical protein
MLDQPICAGVSNCCPVYSYVVVITEVQDLLSGELGVVVGDDSIGTPKAEGNVLDKSYSFFGANFGQGLSLDPLGELVNRDKQVGEAPGRFFEGSQEIQAPQGKGPCDGDDLEFLGWRVDLSCKVLAPHARPHNLNCIIGGRRPVKTLPEGFIDHAP